MFVSILQIVSTMAYMVYVGEFSNLLQYQSFRTFGYYCKYLELQEFLKNNRVSKNLMKIVNQYTLHLWRESRGVQVPYFLETAPNCLKLKVMSAAYLRHLKNHLVFECCEPAFLRQLVGHLKFYIYQEGMYVVKQNEITNAMYIIHSGRVIETCENENTSKPYYSDQYFGVVQGLVYDYPHTHSYQCTRKSQILTLRLEDWEYLLNHFPKSKECIFKAFTYDDGSSDNSKDKVIKKERKVTIAQVGDDDMPKPKSSEQTTTSARKSKTSLPSTSDLPSALKKEGKPSRSSSGVYFALHADNSGSSQRKINESSSSEEVMDKKEAKTSLEYTDVTSKLENDEELIVLRDNTDNHFEDHFSVVFGENIMVDKSREMALLETQNEVYQDKKVDVEPESTIVLYDENKDKRAVFGENIMVDKNEDMELLEIKNEEYQNKKDDIEPESALVLYDENKEKKSVLAENIMGGKNEEMELLEIKNEDYQDNKDDIEPELALVLYDENKDKKVEEPTSSIVRENQSLYEENKNDDQQSKENDDGIISQILDPTSSQESDMKIFISGKRQSDQDKPSK